MKKLLMLVLGLASVVPSALAFDKNAFAIHVRKALGLDTRTEVVVVEGPVPSEINNLNVVKLTLGGAPYSVYMTPDEKKYLWGMLIDNTVDPDKTRMAGINLKKVHGKGSESAPVTLVEYSDFQCGYCKNAHDILKKELHTAYTPSQVRFVFKHFPLNGHDWAEAAAEAAECAGAQKESAFWEIGDYFFDNQSKINSGNVREMSKTAAKNLKLDQGAFGKCLESGVMVAKVRADKSEGTAIGVSSTPTLIINGRTRRGFRDFEDVKVVIEEKLKEAKK